MGAGAVAVAFIAGVLTSLSPCVLPILPIVLGAAASERKYGPAALAAGLAVSFVAVGLFVATIGFSIGLTADLFRRAAEALQRWRQQILSGGQSVRVALGALLVVMGILVLAGLDKRVEAVLVDASPQWLTELTTRY